jgi:hypothetical protein
MALAMINPEPAKGGVVRAGIPKIPEEVSKQRLSHARTVLKLTPDVAPAVVGGAVALHAASSDRAKHYPIGRRTAVREELDGRHQGIEVVARDDVHPMLGAWVGFQRIGIAADPPPNVILFPQDRRQNEGFPYQFEVLPARDRRGPTDLGEHPGELGRSHHLPKRRFAPPARCRKFVKISAKAINKGAGHANTFSVTIWVYESRRLEFRKLQHNWRLIR